MANDIPNFNFESMLFFCKWDVLIIRNRQKMYNTRGFCNIVVILTHKWLFSMFLHLYLSLSRFNRKMCITKNVVSSKLSHLFSMSCSCLNPHFSLTLSSSFAKITLSNSIPNAKIVIIDAIMLSIS